MLKRVAAYLLGQVRIEVTRGQVETFLNLAVAQGIDLWGIQRTPNTMRASLTLGDFYALRPVARGSRCHVHILGRRGLPFAVGRLKRRPVLIAGGLVAAAFIYWASGHIWFVKVKITGPQNLDPRAVEAVAAEAGLKVGVWSGNVDVTKVQTYIQQKMGEVSWAVIRMQGTRVVIEVVEKSAYHVTNQVGCINLVARTEGVVEQIVPFLGEPVIKKGDTVKAGDLLVECSLRYWPGGRPSVYPGTPKPPREGIAKTVVAQARVMARVSHREYLEIPRVRTVAVPTGRSVTSWVLNWKDRPILQQGADNLPFGQHQTQRQVYGLGSWRNWKIPVELVRLTTEEVEMHKEAVPVSQAADQAKEKATDRLRWQLGPADRVLHGPVVEVVEQGKEFIGIRLIFETLEEITQPREGTPPGPPPPGNGTPARP